MNIKKLNIDDRRLIYLVWEIPIHPDKGLINLRAVCAKVKLANLYKTMLERDLPSVKKEEASIFIEKAILNHLFAYSMLNTIVISKENK